MAPATLTVGTGLEYKPDEHNSITLSPLTSKNTFVVSDTVSHKRYNVDEDRYVRSETGLYLKWVYKNKFWKNIEVNSVAEFFSNYFHKPQNVDVDWNLEMIFPINYHVRTTINQRLTVQGVIKTGHCLPVLILFEELNDASRNVYC